MIKLSKHSPDAPKKADEKEYKKKTDELAKEIGEMSLKLYAEKKHAVLIVIQGMDASGKDGVTKSVFKYCNPLVIDAHPFRKPSEEEFAHDFLWRVHKYAPAKGQMKIFIRSHYEDILIQRVHKWITEPRVKMRMNAINAFESILQQDNNTTIIKCYLNISQKRQKEKLQERLEEPDKFWKHNAADWEETKLWNQYMKCYEDVINWSTAPWDIIPADSRWYRNYCAAVVVHKALKKLNPQFPPLVKDAK